MTLGIESLKFIGEILAVIHLCGIICAANALLYVPSSQSAIAWCFSLVLFPYVALPLYFIFGRNRFRGYAELRQSFRQIDPQEYEEVKQLFQAIENQAPHPDFDPEFKTFEVLAHRRFVAANDVRLIQSGQQTFEQIIKSISQANQYVLIQFYIIRDDEIGKALKHALIATAQRSVRCYVLYDEIGSHQLSEEYVSELTNSGISILPFDTTNGFLNTFQLNFRNHRKIVIVDGLVGFIGGHNVGDEYLGKSKQFGTWVDLHIRIEGPEVLALQSVFLGDWYWASRTALDLNWKFDSSGKGKSLALTLATGPVDGQNNCGLFFHSAINCARKRLWIATPYFGPDDSIIQALKLAALRGVDVRILLPLKPDHFLVWLASFWFIRELAPYHIKFYRYATGFLHEKSLLLDDRMAAIGTANLDNRSINLNFEVTTLCVDREICQQLAKRFEHGFSESVDATLERFEELSIFMRLGSRLARLFAPVL